LHAPCDSYESLSVGMYQQWENDILRFYIHYWYVYVYKNDAIHLVSAKWNHMGHWEIEEFNLGAFLLNDSLTKTCFVVMVICLEHLSDIRERHYSCWATVILRCDNIKVLILGWCILLRSCFNKNHKSISFVRNKGNWFVVFVEYQSWPNTQTTWPTAVKKLPHVWHALVRSHGAHKWLAAVHESVRGIYFSTEQF
jgi:hypothetical protein